MDPCHYNSKIDPSAKSIAKLSGQCSCKAFADENSKHKHREFLTQQKTLLAVTGLLEEKVLPLLVY